MYKVYGLINCNYCKNATLLLQANGLTYVYFSLDKSEDMLNEIKQKHNWRTVPLVILDGQDGEQFIGGYDDLRKHIQSLGDEDNSV